MNDRKIKLKTGIFVCAALFLLLAMLFFFGLSEIFSEKIHLVTTFSESVQGLSVGSAVKYRGVQIGTVTDVTIMGDEKLVRVDMSIDPSHFVSSKDFSNRAERFQYVKRFLKKEMRQGLRGRLEFAGITGMKFIDLDYHADASSEPPSLLKDLDEKTIYVASVTSSFKDIAVAMTSALEQISKIKFEEIAEELEHSLQDVGALISDPALKSSIERINEIASNLENASSNLSQVLNRERLEKLVAASEESLVSVNRLCISLQNSSEQMRLPESAEAFRNAVNAMREVRHDVANALLQLNATLESIQRLTDRFNQDPGFIFNGGRSSDVPPMLKK